MKKVVTFGEVMLRLAAPEYKRFAQTNSYDACFGGGEANVAASLANYGIPVDFVSRLPENDLANACIAEMRGLGIGTDKIARGGDRIGIYFLEHGAVSRASKVIYDRAFSSFSSIEPGMINWEEALKDVAWFHWTGITPAVSEGAAKVCLEGILTASKMGITISCDLNYRKKLWKYGKTPLQVMPELVQHCDVILGNEEDAEKCLGIAPEGVDIHKGTVTADAYLPVMTQIMHRFPKAKKVVTTLRGSVSASHNSWSGVMWNGKDLITAPTYQITNIVDRVGGGDSFMGGLIYGLINFDNDDEALRFAVAASCLKHTIHGDFNRATIEEVKKLMGGDASGRVSR